jgi:acetyl-CoA carboxylase carboxyltransferase component
MRDPEELAAPVREGHVDPGGIDGERAVTAATNIRAAASLPPLKRLELLCDEGSLQVIRSEITSERMGDRARAGDGVVAGAGVVGGRPVFCYAQDATFAGGSLGTAHADTIVRVQRLARKTRTPIIGFIESGGARLQEGTAALNGYGRIFHEHIAMSGEVPQISIITGTSAGGGSYSPALTDFVIMTEAASMFLTGPAVVREVTGEEISASALGGPRVHERNGVCHFSVGTDVDAVFLIRNLLGYLPKSAWDPPPTAVSAEPDGDSPGTCVPFNRRQVYDVRDVLGGIVDARSILEVSSCWAPNMVTALARLDGRSIGVVANQPRHLAGVIDADAAQKAARFVRTCNAFGLPLVVIVDTPGFLPGSKQETLGVIRHGAKLLHAFSEASVPRVTVVLRKAFGGAYITMNSRDIGADLTLAWKRAEIGIMGAEQAVRIVHRRKLTAADDPADLQRGLAEEYAARHLGADNAAREGHVDEIILPGETRARLIWALRTLGHNGRRARVRNIPL